MPASPKRPDYPAYMDTGTENARGVHAIRVLQDKERLLAIMKDGKFHKRPQTQEQRRRLTA